MPIMDILRSMEETVSIKDFRSKLGSYLDAAGKGKVIILTSFGRNRAVLISPEMYEDYKRLKTEKAGESDV